MNKMILIGNLTRDPELRYTQNNVAVCNFSVAVNGRKNGDQQETIFFRVAAWRQLGENCAKYLAKGRKVYVSGPLTASLYTGQDGKTRLALDVTAQEVEFLSSRADAEAAPASAASEAPEAPTGGNSGTSGGFTQVEDDELPF